VGLVMLFFFKWDNIYFIIIYIIFTHKNPYM